MYARASGPLGVADGGHKSYAFKYDRALWRFRAAVGWVRGRTQVAQITHILGMIVHLGVSDRY